MPRMSDAAEAERAALENSLMNLRRNVSDLDLAILRIHQAIQRHHDLADLLNPAVTLVSASKRRSSNAFSYLSGLWAADWSLKR